MKLLDLLRDPVEFFEKVRIENWKPAFIFFLEVTLFLSVVTPVVNHFGVESTDFSSAYQAQIMAYRFTKNYLIAQYGVFAYLLEAILIVAFASGIVIFAAGFVHVLYRLLGGKGSILNGWKAACYGVGPCALGGFLPYFSLFAAFYSVLMQLYMGPKVLYGVEEWKALLLLAVIMALIFVEMFIFGTTTIEFR